MAASLLINSHIILLYYHKLGYIPEQKYISSAHDEWFCWWLWDILLALVIKFLLVHGLFAEVSRHSVSIINLILSNNCKSRKSIERAVWETWLWWSLKWNTFPQVCSYWVFVECLTPGKGHGDCLIHLELRNVDPTVFSVHTHCLISEPVCITEHRPCEDLAAAVLEAFGSNLQCDGWSSRLARSWIHRHCGVWEPRAHCLVSEVVRALHSCVGVRAHAHSADAGRGQQYAMRVQFASQMSKSPRIYKESGYPKPTLIPECQRWSE